MQISTEYNNIVNNFVSAQNDRLSNPYYKFIDKKPTVVTYYNINTKKSTLAEGTRLNYDQLGHKSPLRYNKINSFILYGIPQFPVNMRLSDYGVESNSIEGQALILPNTLIPFNDDYFLIPYLTKPYIFRINNISIDTLENGSNFYLVDYHLDNTIKDYEEYLNTINLANTYNFKIDNVGTNKACFLTDTTDDLMKSLDNIYSAFREYYINLFYRANIQTFVYTYLDMFVYDPYLIEFLIRNRLFAIEDDKYMYIGQAVHRDSTFSIEYNRSIFRNIEKRNPKFNINPCYPVPVHDPNSLLMYRIEEYVELSINLHNRMRETIDQLSNDLYNRIVENRLYDENDKNHYLYRNIIINYMNNDELTITEKEIQSLMEMRIEYNKDLFYEIPILMYIINNYCNKTLETVNNQSGEKNGLTEKCYALGD